MTVIYFLLLLSFIVLVHELGHLITAKIFKVYCYEFSIGMGFKLFSIKGKETIYSIRALPIGGFVAMAGEDENDRDIVVPFERTIKGIAKWKQIIIMLAGIFMNFVLAWIIISGLFMYNGTYVSSPKPIVESVVENSPAQEAGLLANDYIKKIKLSDGMVITPKSFSEILPFIQDDKEVIYTIVRGNETLEIPITPKFDTEKQIYFIGIKGVKGTAEKINIFNAPYYSAKFIVDMTKTMFITLVRLFKGVGLNNVSGPIGVYSQTAKQISLGFYNVLMLMAMLSLNIGIFNLLPLPVLDGGRALITFGEMITGKTLNRKVEMAIMMVGWILILGLMIFSTWQDIAKLI